VPYKQGERVRVPHPEGEGTVEAVVVVVAKLGRSPRIAWVRYVEGPEAGLYARIDYAEMERAA
jgi:hypothetical protein